MQRTSMVAHQDFLSGGGEMGEKIRNYDWTTTSLGTPDTWPHSLRTIVRIMLTSQQPIWIGWGKDLIKLYNDPYRAIVGGKHPWALGQPASIVWKDIWSEAGPRLERVLSKNEGTYDESLLLLMERFGYREETYYTFSYSPVPDDTGDIGGIFCANTEDTQRILGERQLTLLRELASQTYHAKSLGELYLKISESLHVDPKDIPFSLLYSLDKNNQILTLSGSTGIPSSHDAAIPTINLGYPTKWPFKQAIDHGDLMVVPNLSDIWDNLPQGSWDRPPKEAAIVPIVPSGNTENYHILVLGLNPYRVLDDNYKGFINLLAGQIATSISNCIAYEEEKKRAEALAEIDKAKTLFFSNVSHELRTPLTLMLGPLEEALGYVEKGNKLHSLLAIAQSNSVRLLKLVNTLLDFSKIEAGKIQAVFRPVDICKLTRELASSFSSAIDKAGISYQFDCTVTDQEIYVDTTMWERIVFNLLSNALKYTFEGKISVVIQTTENHLQLSVKDTGTGIPKEELPKLFTRFHRIENVKGRTHEGTGIGLAMVQELVKLHGGTIEAQSELGKGSNFIITLPLGKGHLPPERIASSQEEEERITLNALPNLGEELKGFDFQMQQPILPLSNFSAKQSKESILLADDNEDMRVYITQLLQPHYNVTAVSDGREALNALEKEKPALVLSDIMMPNLNGVELLNEIRATPSYSTLPVILISARAGEEATIEGIEAGADDYLVKPFSPKELISRVNSNIRISRQRTEAEKNLRKLFEQIPVGISIFEGPNHTISLANEKTLEVWGKPAEAVMNKTVMEVFPELRVQGFEEILNNVYQTGESFYSNEMPLTFQRNGTIQTLHINFVYKALRNFDSQITGIVGVGVDVTELVNARKEVERHACELEDKNQLLTKINNDLDNFIYTASHDLKAPVSNLEGLFNTLMAEMEPQEDLALISSLINESFDRFKNTILDLTEITKVQKGDNSELELVKFEEILKDVNISVKDLLEKYEGEILPNFQVEEIKFSRKNLRSILYNFLSNSLKYSAPNRKPIITLSTTLQDGYTVLTIADNGLGISQENLQNIFQMFKRFHDHVEGTGIGLYIIKRIMDNAGGKIEAESQVDKGTTFRIYFKNQ